MLGNRLLESFAKRQCKNDRERENCKGFKDRLSHNDFSVQTTLWFLLSGRGQRKCLVQPGQLTNDGSSACADEVLDLEVYDPSFVVS
jgi:hypothetical protein